MYHCNGIRSSVSYVCTFADVSIEVIANFNKMKSFTEDRALIIKAMKNSPLLEVQLLSYGRV